MPTLSQEGHLQKPKIVEGVAGGKSEGMGGAAALVPPTGYAHD